jgi:predicted RecA/RadA family phage recombinase
VPVLLFLRDGVTLFRGIEMKNFLQDGKTITLTAPTGGVTGGLFYKIGLFFGCAAFSAAEAASFELCRSGAFTGVPKATSETWAEGELLYWDDSAKKFTKTSTSNSKQAIVLAVAGSSATVGDIVLAHSI